MVSQFKRFHSTRFGLDVLNNKQDVATVYAQRWMYREHLFQIPLADFFSPHLTSLCSELLHLAFPWSLVLNPPSLPLLVSQQPYAPPPHPMAPPSPSTNSCSQGGAEQLSKTNLYIRGLPPGTTDQDLIKLCQPWVLATVTLTHRWHMCCCMTACVGVVWRMLIYFTNSNS